MFLWTDIGSSAIIKSPDKWEFVEECDSVKTPSRLAVAIFGACAVIWVIRVILEVVYQTYNDSGFWFVLNILCAVIWIAAFVVNLKRYRSDK